MLNSSILNQRPIKAMKGITMKTTFSISNEQAAASARLHTAAWKRLAGILMTAFGPQLVILVAGTTKAGGFSIWFAVPLETEPANLDGGWVSCDVEVFGDWALYNVRSPKGMQPEPLAEVDKMLLVSTLAASAKKAEEKATADSTEKQIDDIVAAGKASGDAGLEATTAQVRELARALQARLDDLDIGALTTAVQEKVAEEVTKSVPDADTMVKAIMSGFMPQLVEMKQAAELKSAEQITEAMAAATAKVDGLGEAFADQLFKAKKEAADNMTAAMAAAAGVQAQAIADAKKELEIARANAKWGVGQFVEDHPVATTIGGLAVVGAIGYGAWLYFGKGDAT